MEHVLIHCHKFNNERAEMRSKLSKLKIPTTKKALLGLENRPADDQFKILHLMATYIKKTKLINYI